MTNELVCFNLENDIKIVLDKLHASIFKTDSESLVHLKWSIIYAHSAAQSFLALILDSSDYKLTFTKNTRSNYDGNLDTVTWLFNRLCDEESLNIGSKEIIKFRSKFSTFFEELQRDRNYFIHQKPEVAFYTRDQLESKIYITLDFLCTTIPLCVDLPFYERLEVELIESKLASIKKQLTRR
ncbi:hypothetical protein ACRTDO_22315 [Vibrio furnissii]|uniref:hypothetical protein n=1 Tax=Vibrio furnissii TaxID=29494 RepID=UPI003D7E9283